MHTDYSITLSPSHSCIPRLLDFIEDRKELPLPKQRELIDLMQHLNAMSIRHVRMCVSRGDWVVEFVVNENRKHKGTAKSFAKAVEDALNSVHRLDIH